MTFFSIALFLFLVFASFLSAASILQSAAHTSYNLKERERERERERNGERQSSGINADVIGAVRGKEIKNVS